MQESGRRGVEKKGTGTKEKKMKQKNANPSGCQEVQVHAHSSRKDKDEKKRQKKQQLDKSTGEEVGIVANLLERYQQVSSVSQGKKRERELIRDDAGPLDDDRMLKDRKHKKKCCKNKRAEDDEPSCQKGERNMSANPLVTSSLDTALSEDSQDNRKTKLQANGKHLEWELIRDNDGPPDEGKVQKDRKHKKKRSKKKGAEDEPSCQQGERNASANPLVTSSVDTALSEDSQDVGKTKLQASGKLSNSLHSEDAEILEKQVYCRVCKEKKRRFDEQSSGTDLQEQDRKLSQTTSTPSDHTVSIAVAGSIVDNAQSLELATMLVGQIARAAVIFRIDEIVVFDDDSGASPSSTVDKIRSEDAEEMAGLFMVRILEYLEVPQYLRRALIPRHKSLSSVGRLPPLDAPHHLRKHEFRPFREGVVVDKEGSGLGSYVDVGLDKVVLVGQSLKPGTRVTVDMTPAKTERALHIVEHATVQQAGIYWGYRVRYAKCLSAVFEECPFEGKYDYCIGTSEHGEKIGPTEFIIPKFKHLLVAFGGLAGLEESLELDNKLKRQSIRSLFHRYLNTCPDQGSRTIRTEEAILISLQYLQTAIQQALSSS